MEFISQSLPQFKANLHAHTTLSDGKLTLEESIRAYKEQGYAVLAITDHERPGDYSRYSTKDFLMLTGWEAYIRPNEFAKEEIYGPEIHLNLFAKDPHNVTYVAYEPRYCKYLPHSEAEALPQAGTDLVPRQYSPAWINRFIAAAKDAGYLVTYNHPVWSMEAEKDILSYEGWFSLEAYNGSSVSDCGGEASLSLYDKLLRLGRFPFVHGADDNHNAFPFGSPRCDSFRAWTMIQAPSLDYGSVITALEQGSFYASTGPTIRALSFEGNKVHVETSPVERIFMFSSPKWSRQVYHDDCSPVTEANFVIPDSCPYVWFLLQEQGRGEAMTRAFTRKELGI